MKGRKTDYETFEAGEVEDRRALRREELILEVTEALCKALDEGHVTRSQLARRLGKSPAFVTQILAGGRNLTLKSLADVADALGARISVVLTPQPGRTARRPVGSVKRRVTR